MDHEGDWELCEAHMAVCHEKQRCLGRMTSELLVKEGKEPGAEPQEGKG